MCCINRMLTAERRTAAARATRGPRRTLRRRRPRAATAAGRPRAGGPTVTTAP